MRDSYRSYVIDLDEPTAIAYFNGAIIHHPVAYARFVSFMPSMVRTARQTEGCLQAKASVASPREFLMQSYWRDEAALRRFYTTPLHVRLMKLVFDHPSWFTLYNETYVRPVSVRYWNAVNGYGLSQPPRTETQAEFYDRTGVDPAVWETPPAA